jgi:hypothetical protein
MALAGEFEGPPEENLPLQFDVRRPKRIQRKTFNES